MGGMHKKVLSLDLPNIQENLRKRGNPCLPHSKLSYLSHKPELWNQNPNFRLQLYHLW